MMGKLVVYDEVVVEKKNVREKETSDK